MIIDCIGDLHGNYPKLDGGDLLIVAGDVSNREQYDRFFDWLALAQYKKKIYIAGNHDNYFFEGKRSTDKHCDATYLCDSGTEFEGLKIWGSPWTLTFDEINPNCTAFTGTEEQLKAKFDLIPDDTDILITHGPPDGILDSVRKYGPFSHEREMSVGSEALMMAIERVRPQLHIFGHIHEGYGKELSELKASKDESCNVAYYNCSHVNEHYEPVNKPIRIIL